MMPWKSIDFEGIVSLNKSVIDHLSQYLEDKETQLSLQILEAIHPFQSPEMPPTLPLAEKMPLKLSEAVDSLGKQVRQLIQGQYTIADPNDWKQSVKSINAGVWSYFETLDECVTELFQQIAQIGIEDWRHEMSNAVDAIKEILTHRLDELQWALKRLESYLEEYRWLSEKQQQAWVHVKKMLFVGQSLLDKRLTTNVSQCLKFLRVRYQSFVENFQGYSEIHTKIEHSMEKFSWYSILNSLDDEVRTQFKKVYELLKLWDANEKTKKLSREETIRALRGVISSDKAVGLFQCYYEALQKALFEKSRWIKESPQIAVNPVSVLASHEEIMTYRGELHTLATTVMKYRDFLLKTDPDPYVRSRLGFPEWIVGPEPKQAKQLLNLSYDVENLDQIFEAFRKSIERKPLVGDVPLQEIQEQIQTVLHDMGQPLQSRVMMKGRAEKLISLVQELDELSSINPKTVDVVQFALSKALRADWKYHALFAIPAFHQVYAIHQGVMGSLEDRNHLNRVHKFAELIQQVEQWVKNNETPRHTHEIETDMNDIKVYLQEFLAHVQRMTASENADPEVLQKYTKDVGRELLEYRYMFGNFFHHLNETKPEERMIRKQFLFVDQYFESVESRLNAVSGRVD